MIASIKKYQFLLAAMFFIAASCNRAPKQEIDGGALLSTSLYHLTTAIIHDIYSPPVASRIYAYTSLAYYEGLRMQDEQSISLTAQLKGFKQMPKRDPKKRYNFNLVALTAYFTVGQKLVFSKEALKEKQQQMLQGFESVIPEDEYEASVQLGEAVADIILQRSMTDNYTKSRGLPRFSVFKANGKWQQTSPDYNDALEPYWNTISPLLLDSAAQFKPAPPPPYSLEKSSLYYKELMEVYTVSQQLTPEQDTIATYWDDNSFVTTHQGHLMYANKKTTPVGHWMGITSILCGQQKVSPLAAARLYALTACAIFDGFISCWDEKYRSSTVRPITVIQQEIDPEWSSLLQTPPFPEYTSGHSVISNAAATLLTRHLGDGIAFTDTTESEYLGLKRRFPSINQAAEEVGISRLYGGIHYRSGIQQGSWQGKQIGNLYLAKIK
jgi:hypothetical protein